MKISTKVVLEICDEIGEFREISRESFEYDGPVALAKKGRDQLQKNMNWQQQAQVNANNAAGYNSDIQSLISELIGSTTPGSLSPAADAMYAADSQKIQNTYNGLRQTAFANSARRGFGGGAPSGFQQSAENAINTGESQDFTNAYRNAQINTANQRSQALNAALGAAGMSNNAALGETSASTGSAVDRSKAGSTLGDVLAAGSSILGGISGLSSFSDMFKPMMQKSYNQQTSNLPLPSVSTGSGIGSY